VAERARGRVLHVTADYGVYSQTFIPDAMLAFERRGWEAWLVTRSVRNRTRFPFPPGERLIQLGKRPGAARVASILRGRAPVSWSDRDIRATAERVRPRIVHAHFAWLPEDSVRLARAAGAPLVVSFYGADASTWPRFPWWEAPRRLASRAPHRYSELFPAIGCALVPTPVVAEQVRALGYEGPLEVLPAGVSLEEFPLRPGPPPEPVRLLFVGRLVRRKGVDVLLRALVECRRSLGAVTLDLYGDGPEREALERLAAELGVRDAVSFHGVGTRADVRQALAGAHALVLPSRTMPDGEIETLGVVLIEALASGVPVVATRSGGIPSAVPPEWRDELVPEETPDELARAIAAAVTHPSREERAARGREWVEAEYSWAGLAARIEQVYLRTLGASDGLSEPPPAGALEAERRHVGEGGRAEPGESTD
jgi:colanic acid/amylovoran biosynthesis glycosyltransferase